TVLSTWATARIEASGEHATSKTKPRFPSRTASIFLRVMSQIVTEPRYSPEATHRPSRGDARAVILSGRVPTTLCGLGGEPPSHQLPRQTIAMIVVADLKIQPVVDRKYLLVETGRLRSMWS